MIRRLNYARAFSTDRKALFPSKNLFRRSDQQSFMAKYRDEGFSTLELNLVKEYRGLADDAIKHANESEFIRISILFLKELQKLPRNSILSCDFKGVNYSRSSHVHEAYKVVLSKAFQRSLYVTGHQLSEPFNYSGHFINGTVGIGKTTVLQLCASVTGQLLPNYISFYTNARQMHFRSTRRLLIEALNEHLPVSERVHSDTPMNAALATANINNIAIGIFVDELQDIWCRDEWDDLRACCTSYHTAVFLSNTYIPHYARLTPQEMKEINWTRYETFFKGSIEKFGIDISF